jgi:DNA-binding NtrC family response regulator
MARRKRVLLFVDFESIRNVLIKSIQKRDCDLIICENIGQALEQLNGLSFELIVCDGDCKQNGAQKFLETLRMNSSYLFTPVVLLVTGNKDSKSEQFGKFNIAGFFPKPCDMSQFNKVLDRFV